MGQAVRLPARVAEVTDHAPGLRSLILKPDRRIPRFRPGQFMHLAIDPYNPSQHWPESRCFSIASSIDEREYLRITVSAVGEFTQRVTALDVGDDVWIKLPFGRFVIDMREQNELVVVAGGTGIAPFMSLFSSREVKPRPIRVLYGAQSPEYLIEAEALDEAETHWPNFEWRPFIESGSRAGATIGMLNSEAALGAPSNPKDADYYLAGPPAMMVAMKAGLHEAGIARSRIFEDSWD